MQPWQEHTPGGNVKHAEYTGNMQAETCINHCLAGSSDNLLQAD
jgi:hypothetical protein